MDPTSPGAATGPAFPCACCGFLSLVGPPGSYEVCKICYWEDDLAQLRFPEMVRGANRVSLAEAQENFRSYNAAERRLVPYVRAHGPGDKREFRWRPFDPLRDDTERLVLGLEYSRGSYPADGTTLYYWRETYWRRVKK